MNDTQSKRKTDGTDMDQRETAESIKRIEDDLYFSADNIKVRLARIEGKLEHVATREDIDRLKIATRDDMEKLRIAMRDDMEKMRITMRDDMEKMNGDTRDDMEEFKSDTATGMAKLNTEMEQFRMNLEQLRTDMVQQKTDLIAHTNTQFRWTVGLLVSVAGVIVTILKLT